MSESKPNKLHDKYIRSVMTHKRKYGGNHKKPSDCPVCSETMDGAVITPLDLVGNIRNTWIHHACRHKITTADEETCEKELAAIEEEAAQAEVDAEPAGIFTKTRSFDRVVEEIATEAARKAVVDVLRDMGPTRVELVYPSGRTHSIGDEEHTHMKFPKIVKLAARRKPVFLTGPTGTGKSHLAKQVANSLTRLGSDEPLPFYETPCSAGITEGHLLGRLLPTGEAGAFEYTHAVLSKAYEEGGVCCLEEIDASDPNTLLCVNNALETEQMTIPNRIEKWYAKRHPDFILIIIGNTTGSGADRVYCGRNQLDGAFIDRFKLRMIEIDYDPVLEAKLCPNDDLLAMLHTWREKIVEAKLRRWISTRTIIEAYEDFECGDSLDDIADNFFVGWPEDEKNIVVASTEDDGGCF